SGALWAPESHSPTSQKENYVTESPQSPSAPSGGPGAGGPGGRPAGRERGRGRPRYIPRRKVCQFCVDKVENIDYKDFGRLRRLVPDRGKIEPRRKTGTGARHQRALSTAIKRARQVALLPLTSAHVRNLGGWQSPPPPTYRGGPRQSAPPPPPPV